MAPQKKPSGRLPANVSMTSGTCMTCATLLSWPEASDDGALIKCRVCAALNRFSPLRDLGRSDSQDGSRVEPISAENTQTIVDECLRSHCLARLCRSSVEKSNGYSTSKILSPVHDHVAKTFATVKAVCVAFTLSQEGTPPMINWDLVSQWYSLIIHPAERWLQICAEVSQRPDYCNPNDEELQAAERDVLSAQNQLQDDLIKVTTGLLRKPGGMFSEPEELSLFLIVLENPLLHSDRHGPTKDQRSQVIKQDGQTTNATHGSLSGPLSGRHSSTIKRIMGLIHNIPEHLQHHLRYLWSRSDPHRFVRTKYLVSGFLSYRLLRHEAARRDLAVESLAVLASELQFRRSDVELDESISMAEGSQRSQRQPIQENKYYDDWQIHASCHVLGLLFDANNLAVSEKDQTGAYFGSATHTRRFLSSSDFYNSFADYTEIQSDFHGWGRGKPFSLSNYPFLLSIWAKTQILKHTLNRQADSASLGDMFSGPSSKFLNLDVRREHLVEDSLSQIGQVLDSDALGRSVRIKFRGEEGIDGGGPRKEWFHLLTREVFSQETGLFVYDEDSQLCYFNPLARYETSTFFSIGAVLGLAIANAVVLDVPFPQFVFRKLVASASSWYPANHFTGVEESVMHSLDDLAEYRPQLAKGLFQLCEYEGNVEETFGIDFTINMSNDTTARVPLCPGGENRPVTNNNRQEYIRLYLDYILSSSVEDQFCAFAEGFYTAYSMKAPFLFRADELELLLKASDEPLDINSLRSATEYEGWESARHEENEDLISWFWSEFEAASPSDQRKLLSFITGSDRLPAVGVAMASLRISFLGDGADRYPIARTCFNLLSLYRYRSRDQLRSMLWRAVHESEGFGLA